MTKANKKAAKTVAKKPAKATKPVLKVVAKKAAKETFKASNKAAKPVKSAKIEVTKDEKATAPTPVVKSETKTPVNTSGFKFVDNVEIPRRTRDGESTYPLASMIVGRSFLVPADVIDPAGYADVKEAKKAQAEALAVVANRMSGACRRFTKRNEGFKFRVATVYTGKALGFDHDIGVMVKRIE